MRKRTRRTEWWRGLPARHDEYSYVVLQRAPSDPERAPRPDRRKGEAPQDAAPHLTIRRTTAEQWAERLAEHMADGRARTFNRMCVELVGKTADVCFSTTLHDALWLLVERQRLEYTPAAPVFFREVRP